MTALPAPSTALEKYEPVAVPATLSIGVTLAKKDGTTDALVARADSAMYRAKHGGRNQVVTFNNVSHPAAENPAPHNTLVTR